MRKLWMNVGWVKYLLGSWFWSDARVWIMVVMGRGTGGTAVNVWPVTSGDHGPSVTPGLHPHYADQWPVLQWGLPTTADIHCSGQMWVWWLQWNWRPRCYPCEQLRAPSGGQQSGRAIAGKCPAVVAILPHIAGYCQSVEHCGKSRLWVSGEK